MTTHRLQVVHSLARSITLRWSATFISLFILTVPFPYQLTPDVQGIFAPFFEVLAKFVGHSLLGIDRNFNASLISDSTGLYIHALDLSVISLVIATICLVSRMSDDLFRYWTLVIARYYLALQLVIYGFSKLFKWQFYLPEPNTLFTPLGDISKDLLYWSSMGSSHLYTTFGGVCELGAAMLLLFRHSTRLGGWVAAGLMLNVVMINLSYDISVKFYSMFLLALALLIIALQRNDHYEAGIARRKLLLGKSVVLACLLIEGLWLYVSTGYYNDDLTPRPPLHGGYDVQVFESGDSLHPPLLTDSNRWRRVFVHRRGYLIVQSMNDKMKDYELRYDTARRNLVVIDPRDSSRSILAYDKTADSTLLLAGTMGGQELHIQLKQIDLSKLPLLRPEFHWTIDR